MNKICSVPGCGKDHFGLGYCQSHHRKFRKYGDPLVVKAKKGRSKCVIEGCDRHRNSAQGYCSTHWLRWKKHGDPMKVACKTPPGEARKYLKEVALAHEGDECLIWPFMRNKFGYGIISKDQRPYIASRLVCELAHGEPPTDDHYAAHSCGNGKGGCVSPRHLSWKTRAENEADKLLHGTRLRGGEHPSAKLTEDQVREIISQSGEKSQPEIAKQYGICRQLVSDIIRGKAWAWLDANIGENDRG